MTQTVTVIDIGNSVLCDQCNEEYLDSDLKGGFLFGSYGICPKCAPKYEERIKNCNEEHFITDRCRDDETFHQFVMRLRNGNNKVTITSWD